MIPELFDCDLEQLRVRVAELDAYALTVELNGPEVDQLRSSVFALGGNENDAWNNYHLVRNEFDRRAAEEFDLGQ